MGHFRRNRGLFFALSLLVLLPLLPLWSQDTQAADPAAFIGLTLGDLIDRFGPPLSVYAVRGLEEWQDDVVFSYGDREFYFYKDRVWQISLKTAWGIRVGENRNVIPLIMGEETATEDTFTLAPLSGQHWPIAARFNNDKNGLVTGIFVYRSDF